MNVVITNAGANLVITNAEANDEAKRIKSTRRPNMRECWQHLNKGQGLRVKQSEIVGPRPKCALPPWWQQGLMPVVTKVYIPTSGTYWGA